MDDAEQIKRLRAALQDLIDACDTEISERYWSPHFRVKLKAAEALLAVPVDPETTPPPPDPERKVVDLMKALEDSLTKAKADRKRRQDSDPETTS